jgi:hypothetical protein
MRYRYLSGAIVAVLGLTTILLAQPKAPPAAGGKTDMKTYAPPANGPKLPKAGGTFVDPVFGTTIMRVTDENDGADSHLAYSYYPTFNKDNTRLHATVGKEAAVYTFDPVAFKLGPKEALHAEMTPANSRARWEDSIWSGVEADAMYAHDGDRLWKHNLKTKNYELVKDFKKDHGFGVKQMSKSIDDNVFAFTLTDDKGQLGAIAWDRRGDKIAFRDDEKDLDEVQLDKSGGYLVVKRNHRGPNVAMMRVVDLKTGKAEGLIDRTQDSPTGHSDNGTKMMIGFDDVGNRFLKRDLKAPHKWGSILEKGKDWTSASHISLLADDEKWCVISFYEWKVQAPPGPLHNEIVMVSTDGSQRVRRLAHHRSVINGEYWNCPFANISRDGKFIAYGSNVDGKGQRDIFVLKVPDLKGK